MALTLGNITFDAEHPPALAAFWSEVLGRAVDPAPPGMEPFFASINRGRVDGPAYLFIKVPEGKSAKNRVHLDWHCESRTAEVDRLLALGATRVADHDEWGTIWTTLRDPEGNEFCVAGGG